jgi:hypothetical protein
MAARTGASPVELEVLPGGEICRKRVGFAALREGLGVIARHFSVEISAIPLGLEMRSVVKVACDSEYRMRPEALRTDWFDFAGCGKLFACGRGIRRSVVDDASLCGAAG